MNLHPPILPQSAAMLARIVELEEQVDDLHERLAAVDGDGEDPVQALSDDWLIVGLATIRFWRMWGGMSLMVMGMNAL